MDVGGDGRQGFACFGSPAAVVGGGAFAFGFFAHGGEFFFAAIAVVGVSAGEQLLDKLFITREILCLVNDVVAIVGMQAYPVHALQDDLHAFGGGAFQVGVFDAQQKFAAVVFGKRP